MWLDSTLPSQQDRRACANVADPLPAAPSKKNPQIVVEEEEASWLPSKGSDLQGEEKRPPLDETSLTDGNKIRRAIEEYYDEAARRLPLDEMPKLRGCIHAGGHCFGLGDPVTNIILNSIALLRGEHPPPPPSLTPTGGWFEIASRSHRGLRAFMTAYFRHLSITQAQRYLCLASHDLSLAIELVHHDRSSGRHRPLLPDGGKMQAALRVAALEAHHPAPDVLAGLMTARYPSDLLYPIMGVMQQQKPLSTDQVREIMKLLASQWPPTPSLANTGFWFHRDSDSSRTTAPRGDREGTLLEFSTPVGEDGDLMAQICIKRTQDHFHSHRPHEYISKLMFRNADTMNKLSNLRMAVNEAGGKHGLPALDRDDAYPCEHMRRYLKMHLLETIHAAYIKALARLPSSAWSARLLHALLVAGHCYGPLDCVSNVILNTIWYSIAFPLAQGAEIQLPQGILCTRALSRMESCSLTGMVAILRGTYSLDNKAICMSDHEAFGFLNRCNCNFMDIIYLSSSDIPFGAAAKAAKHPKQWRAQSVVQGAADRASRRPPDARPPAAPAACWANAPRAPPAGAVRRPAQPAAAAHPACLRQPPPAHPRDRPERPTIRRPAAGLQQLAA
ncbi:uncharacterized protein C2845_PM17G06890 [Panicum miliaceum]|uniref:PIR2-like helical domain-containing protein n=1 Tax=Panicum miliaceum TaxID=4540 RepID=A0A3L6Q3A8_PANMI|nr:uncharacterized protein C2845_PM17G06890 [Panicum miliaceum]